MSSDGPAEEFSSSGQAPPPTAPPKRDRRLLYFVFALIGAAVIVGYVGLSRAKENLSEASLPEDLLVRQNKLNTLILPRSISNIDWVSSNLKHLDISDSRTSEMDILPDSLQTLAANHTRLRSIHSLPPTLRSLDLLFSTTDTIPTLPKELTSLSLSGAVLKAIGVLPPRLEHLTISEYDSDTDPFLPSSLHDLHICGGKGQLHLRYPNQLADLEFRDSDQKSLGDLPKRLQTLTLTGNKDLKVNHLPRHLRRLYTDGGTPPNLSTSVPYLQELHQRGGSLKAEVLPRYLRILDLQEVDGFDWKKLPETLQDLSVSGGRECSLPPFPPKLEKLSIKSCGDIRLSLLPRDLRVLNVSWSRLVIDGNWPPHLQTLQLRQTNLPTDALASLPTSLKKLEIHEYSLQEVKGLGFLNSLEQLDLSGCPALAKVGLADLPLKRLSLAGSALSSLPQLPAGLEYLDISGTPIGSLSGLPGGLEELFVSAGQVKTLVGLPSSVHVLGFLDEGSRRPALSVSQAESPCQ